MTYVEKVEEAKQFLLERIDYIPDVLLILGSGLGDALNKFNIDHVFKYTEIPHWPHSSAPGHKGNLLFLRVAGHKLAIMQGRIHAYEGYTMQEVTFPIRVLASMGVRTLFATNASGGIPTPGKVIRPGTIIGITDHINFTGQNPLTGINNQEWGGRFPDMTHTYDREYLKIMDKVAAELSIDYTRGIYMGFAGPSYETPSEIRMAQILGANCVGMSTVPEVIVARQMGMRIVVLSCVSNFAAGVTDAELTEEEVLTTIGANASKLANLAIEFLKAI